MKDHPLLTSQRLRLRALDLQDEQEIFALRSDDRVNAHLDRAPAQSIEDARAFIAKIHSLTVQGDHFYWAICLKENPRLIGTISYFNFSKLHASAEIGYELHPFYQGKGIMQEAISLVIQFGFQVMELKSIIACPSKGNAKSIQLLKRKGFTEVDNDTGEENLLKFALER